MKNLFLILFISLSISSFAQSDDIYKTIADKTCSCLDEKELTKDNLELNLGVCMMEVINDYPELTNSISLKNTKSMEKLGENVGLQMAFICPEVFLLMTEEETKPNKKSYSSEEKTSTKTGVIEGFDGKEIKYLLLKDDKGRINKFLWLRSFSGDADLMKLGRDALGERVKVTYTEIEIYNPEMDEYIQRKEIKSISF